MEYIYLNQYAEKMKQVAEECVSRVLKGHEDGKYILKIPNLKKEIGMQSLDETLLIDMLMLITKKTDVRNIGIT